jgi:hypothetical protein
VATIGDLVVKLGLNSRGFNRGLQRATQRTTLFQRTVSRLGGFLKGALVAAFATVTAAVSAAVFAFGRLVKKSFEINDELGKMSDRLGLMPEVLGGLQHAAELSGVSVTELGTAMRMMLRNVSDASRGMGEAQDAFDMLGLDAGDIRQLSPDEQLFRIARAMEGVTNEADRTSIAMDLFGRSGAQMLSLLDDGEKSIRAMVEEFDELGGALDRQEISRLEAANDAIQRMKTALGGAANQIAVMVAPGVVAAAETLTRAFKGMGEALERIRNADIPPILRILAQIGGGGTVGGLFIKPGDVIGPKFRGQDLAGGGAESAAASRTGLATGALRGSREAAQALAGGFMRRGNTIEEQQLRQEEKIEQAVKTQTQVIEQLAAENSIQFGLGLP